MSEIKSNGIISSEIFLESLETKVLDDGSKWEKIYEFDYDISGSVWTLGEAKSCNSKGKFSILGQLNEYTTDSGWFEFWYAEGTKYIRWKQSYNPLSRYTSSSSGTSSEYTFISGTTSSSFYGLTRYTADDSSYCYLRGYPSWWGAIAPYQTSYDVFPSMWGGSSNNHKQELWIRIDGLKTEPILSGNKVKITSTSIKSNNFIEY